MTMILRKATAVSCRGRGLVQPNVADRSRRLRPSHLGQRAERTWLMASGRARSANLVGGVLSSFAQPKSTSNDADIRQEAGVFERSERCDVVPRGFADR